MLAHAAVLAGAGRAPVGDLARGITAILDRTDPRFQEVAEAEAAATREAGEAKRQARQVAELAIVLGRDPESERPGAAEAMLRAWAAA